MDEVGERDETTIKWESGDGDVDDLDREFVGPVREVEEGGPDGGGRGRRRMERTREGVDVEG